MKIFQRALATARRDINQHHGEGPHVAIVFSASK